MHVDGNVHRGSPSGSPWLTVRSCPQKGCVWPKVTFPQVKVFVFACSRLQPPSLALSAAVVFANHNFASRIVCSFRGYVFDSYPVSWSVTLKLQNKGKGKGHPRNRARRPRVLVKLLPYSFFNLGVRVRCSTPRPARFTPWGKTRYPFYRRLGGPRGRSGPLRTNPDPPLPGFDPRTVQPVASRCTDWATPFHKLQDNNTTYVSGH